MINNYLISIDINKLYENLDNDSNDDSNNDSNDDSNSIKLIDKIQEYYTLDTFEFDEYDILKLNLIDKYNIQSHDLFLLNKCKLEKSYLTNTHKYLQYNKGLINFDIGMLSNPNIILNIIFLFQNYSNLMLSKIHDNYLLYFNDKINKSDHLMANNLSTNQINLDKLNNKILHMFMLDVDELLLYQQIKNIPKIINNKHMIKKIKNDLSYSSIIKSDRFNSYFNEISITKQSEPIKQYEQNLVLELFQISLNVEFVLNNSNNFKQIDDLENKIHKIFEQFYDQNSYIDNIYDKISPSINFISSCQINNHCQSRINNDQSNINYFNITQSDELNSLNEESNAKHLTNRSILSHNVQLIDLLNMRKLTDIYNLIKPKINYMFKMNNIMNTNVNICLDKNNSNHLNLTLNEFINNTLLFINELTKRKIKHIIQLYNYKLNKLEIDQFKKNIDTNILNI